METVLELRSVSKQYLTHRAVNSVSLSLAPGEFFSLVGPSGCGKTTTLRMIAGFEQPTSGDIMLEEASLRGLPPYRRNVSTVFQSYALFPHLTVAQNLAFGLERQRSFRKREICEKVERALSLVELAGKENRLPAQLSGGEKQRVALARSLVLEPKVLLLDEPLSALDPQLRKKMRNQLKELQRRVGIAFLFVTHDQEEALSMSDRMAIMNGGKLEQVGTPRELYRRPASRFVAEFLGELNWLNGVAVRPESVRVSREQPDASVPSCCSLVRATIFFGNRVQLHTELSNGASCTAELTESDARFAPGETVHLWWHPSDELPISRAA
jgi:ABC-type Fe3+/spermidine/putrescine transport system ATPase subunit